MAEFSDADVNAATKIVAEIFKGKDGDNHFINPKLTFKVRVQTPEQGKQIELLTKVWHSYAMDTGSDFPDSYYEARYKKLDALPFLGTMHQVTFSFATAGMARDYMECMGPSIKAILEDKYKGLPEKKFSELFDNKFVFENERKYGKEPHDFTPPANPLARVAGGGKETASARGA